MKTKDLNPREANISTDMLENFGGGLCKATITHGSSTYSAQTLDLDLAVLLSFQPLLSLPSCFPPIFLNFLRAISWGHARKTLVWGNSGV